MPKTSVVIIGAGLAGLATAYELAKDDRFSITLLEERDRVGGRTFTANASGIPVDVGGFIIYPWYKTFHRIVNELKCTQALQPIPTLDILYDLTGNGTFIAEKNVPISLSTKGRLATKLLPALFNNLDVAHPNTNQFGEMSMRDFLNSALPHHETFKSYVDIICQGYCYPSIDEYRATFMLPMMGSNLFFGDIKSASYLPQGMQTLHTLLEDVLKARGVTIQLNTHVTSIKKSLVTAGTITYKAQHIVVTHPIANEISFTRFATVTVACTGKLTINRKTTWGALFLHPTTCPSPNILSVINDKHLYGKKLNNTLTLNIRLNESDEEPGATEDYAKRITQALKKIFPHLDACTITSYTPWKHTMPLSTTAYVNKLKATQGKNGIYYAGDYLGCPSMETALTTGVDAAELIKQNS